MFSGYRFTSFALVCALLPSPLLAQISNFPYSESFDTLFPPALPQGWTSSQNRTPGVNDFTSTSSSSHSAPNALLSTNATIEQELYSPLFGFLDAIPDSISFFTRRSSTHTSPVVLEVSLDAGGTFPIQVGDTLHNPGPATYFRSSFSLPETLSSSSSVMFRWRIIPGTSGSTGTFRMDDVVISTRFLDDLSLASVELVPQYPVVDDTVGIIATILNVGLRAASGFAAELYLDLNEDSTGQKSELIATMQSVAPLEPGDSTPITLSGNLFTQGAHVIIVSVSYDEDRNLSNNSVVLTLTVGYPRASVSLNEIMYAPSGSEPEWLEIYNTTEDSLDLNGWEVSDINTASRTTITGTSFLILPGSFIVVTDDSAALFDVHPDIPVHVFQAPSLPSFNNTGDLVALYDQRGAVMDSVPYAPDWGGSSGGKSLERVDPAGSSISPTNWGSSGNLHGSTPGKVNSLTRKNNDLSISTVLFVPPTPTIGDSVLVISRILNRGKNAAPSFSFKLFEDVNRDSVAAANELLSSIPSSAPLSAGDSIDISTWITTPVATNRLLILQVLYAADEDTTNNILLHELIVGELPGSLVINEIMYAPPTGMPEWVEIVNASNDSVDIQNWKIGNRLSRYSITTETRQLAPGMLLVMTKDTALLALSYPLLSHDNVLQVTSLPTFLWNNSGDAVVLLDNRGVVMDSLYYDPLWGGTEGASLERIDALEQSQDPGNWSSSTDPHGGTPGLPNSVVRLDHDLRILRVDDPNTQAGTTARIAVVVLNSGRLPSNSFSVMLYNDINHDSLASGDELIDSTVITQSLAPQESLSVTLDWNQPASGTYTVITLLEYPGDMRTSDNMAISAVHVGFSPGAIVINEIMYAPLPGNSEYVEFSNPGKTDVDLSGWTLSDLPGNDGQSNTFTLASGSQIFHPGEFFVLAADSSALDLFPFLTIVEPRLLTIANKSLSLNNEGDRIVLRDPGGSNIDSLDYFPSWHHPSVTDETGRSLEKINPLLRSSDPRSWSTCTRTPGGTPGEQNSLYSATVPSASRLSFSPNPFSPDGDGYEDVTIIHFELPLAVATISVSIYDVRGRLIRRLADNEPSGSRGEIVWNGYDDEQQKARIGMYVVYLEALSVKGGTLETAKGVVVLAARF